MPHDSALRSLTGDKDTTWQNQQLFLAPTKEVVKQKNLSKNSSVAAQHSTPSSGGSDTQHGQVCGSVLNIASSK